LPLLSNIIPLLSIIVIDINRFARLIIVLLQFKNTETSIFSFLSQRFLFPFCLEYLITNGFRPLPLITETFAYSCSKQCRLRWILHTEWRASRRVATRLNHHGRSFMLCQQRACPVVVPKYYMYYIKSSP
jgi:hypothetical protein